MENTAINLNDDAVKEQLSSLPGYAELKRSVMLPMLENSHEQKIIYVERQVTWLVEIEKMQISDHGFFADVRKLYLIENRQWRKADAIAKMEKWNFGGGWEYLRTWDNVIYAYGGWRVWTDPKLVQEVEKFMQNGEPEKAIFAIFGDKDKW